MATFAYRDIIGKDLYAAKNIIGYVGTPMSKTIMAFKKGQIIGTVYSMIPFGSNPTRNFWDFKTLDGKGRYFVENIDGNFDISQLRAQGVQDATQKTKAAEDKAADENTPWYEKLGQGVQKTVLILGSVGILGYLGLQYIKGKKS